MPIIPFALVFLPVGGGILALLVARDALRRGLLVATAVAHAAMVVLAAPASPRHGDGVAVTGPVTRNMRDALLWTYAASPDPRVSVAVGACAISGGIYAGLPETSSGATELLPVDLFIPGCPPHPLTILHGLLGLIGRLS
ncbi:MAG: putative hydrogenase-4 component [Desulfomicrobiaceae bacterium]|jgi:Ni,Fe-hydrogenase III small subunit|nr:putative hydrogenase-4 component [Desulfomicrobiaceae bacterium]